MPAARSTTPVQLKNQGTNTSNASRWTPTDQIAATRSTPRTRGVFIAGKGGDGARCIDLSHILGHDRSNVVGDGGRRNCQRDGLAPTLLRRQWLPYAEPKNI